MLATLFEHLLRSIKPKQMESKPRPMQFSVKYNTPAAYSLFKNVPLDVARVYKNASQLPLMRDAELSFCDVSSGTQFVGFNRPKKVCGYIIVYPKKNLKDERARLFKIAQINGINVGVLELSEEQKCIQVTKSGKSYFLVNPESLRLRGWSYVANRHTAPPSAMATRSA